VVYDNNARQNQVGGEEKLHGVQFRGGKRIGVSYCEIGGRCEIEALYWHEGGGDNTGNVTGRPARSQW